MRTIIERDSECFTTQLSNKIAKSVMLAKITMLISASKVDAANEIKTEKPLSASSMFVAFVTSFHRSRALSLLPFYFYFVGVR